MTGRTFPTLAISGRNDTVRVANRFCRRNGLILSRIRSRRFGFTKMSVSIPDDFPTLQAVLLARFIRRTKVLRRLGHVADALLRQAHSREIGPRRRFPGPLIRDWPGRYSGPRFSR